MSPCLRIISSRSSRDAPQPPEQEHAPHSQYKWEHAEGQCPLAHSGIDMIRAELFMIVPCNIVNNIVMVSYRFKVFLYRVISASTAVNWVVLFRILWDDKFMPKQGTIPLLVHSVPLGRFAGIAPCMSTQR